MFSPKRILLKNGSYVELREAGEEDAENLISTIKEYSEESEFIPTSQGEFNPTLEQELSWIRFMQESENSICLLAVYEGRIIGNLSINGSQKKLMKHTAIIGLGLLNECRGKGIGHILLSEGIKWAKENTILDYLYLETMSSNSIAKSLYERCGFHETGVKPNEIKYSNEQYLDTIIMSLNVKNNN